MTHLTAGDVAVIAVATAALVLLALYVLARFYVIPRGRTLLLEAVMPPSGTGMPPDANSTTNTDLQDLVGDDDAPDVVVGEGDVADRNEDLPPGVSYERSDE